MRARAACSLFILMLALAPPAEAQEDSLPPTTYARRGMFIGGALGGAAGAAVIGLLAQAFCESECDGAFLGGAVVGGLGGAAVGGLTGLVVGAAIPRSIPGGGEAPPEEPSISPVPEPRVVERAPRGPERSWAVRMGVGPTWPVHAESGTTRTWASIAVLRPTSARVDWGAEAGYLGTRTEVNRYIIPITQADTAVITTTSTRTLWSASLMALRRLGVGPNPSGYVLATAGVYPYEESVTGTRTGDPPHAPGRPPFPDHSTQPLPGVGVGAGGLFRLGKWVSLGADARLHVILGARDELGTAVASVGGTIWLGR